MKQISRRHFFTIAGAGTAGLAWTGLAVGDRRHLSERVGLRYVSAFHAPFLTERLKPGQLLRANLRCGKMFVYLEDRPLGYLPERVGAEWQIAVERGETPAIFVEAIGRNASGRMSLLARIKMA